MFFAGAGWPTLPNGIRLGTQVIDQFTHGRSIEPETLRPGIRAAF
jgi:hypothetical protein